MKKRIPTFLMAAAMCIGMTACSTVDEADTGAAGGTDTTGEDTASGETASGLPALTKDEIHIGAVFNTDLGTEGFSYVAEAVPSRFICRGAGGPDQYPHHNPRMVLDESVFFKGAAIHANCAMEWLSKHGK